MNKQLHPQNNSISESELDVSITSENLAIPEIHINETAQDQLEESEEEIDYSGAIPEVHFRKK